MYLPTPAIKFLQVILHATCYYKIPRTQLLISKKNILSTLKPDGGGGQAKGIENLFNKNTAGLPQFSERHCKDSGSIYT